MERREFLEKRKQELEILIKTNNNIIEQNKVSINNMRDLVISDENFINDYNKCSQELEKENKDFIIEIEKIDKELNS